MRVRDMRPGRRVRVKSDAPGSLIPVRRMTGTIVRVDNRIAVVKMDVGVEMRHIDARNLEGLAAGEAPAKPADSPELAAYKQKVARLAQRLGREHNMCDVLDDALREIDVEPLPQQMAVITLRIPEHEFTFEEDGGDDGDAFAATVADQLEGIFDDAPYLRRRGYVTNVMFEDYTDLEKEEYS